VYHELLCSYMAFARTRGFTTAHIWACPPQRGDGYIFHNHPQQQKTPDKRRLRAWYVELLAYAQREGVVQRTLMLADEYFDADGCLRDDRGLPPFFAGDLWTMESERVLRDLNKPKGKGKVSRPKKVDGIALSLRPGVAVAAAGGGVAADADADAAGVAVAAGQRRAGSGKTVRWSLPAPAAAVDVAPGGVSPHNSPLGCSPMHPGSGAGAGADDDDVEQHMDMEDEGLPSFKLPGSGAPADVDMAPSADGGGGGGKSMPFIAAAVAAAAAASATASALDGGAAKPSAALSSAAAAVGVAKPVGSGSGGGGKPLDLARLLGAKVRDLRLEFFVVDFVPLSAEEERAARESAPDPANLSCDFFDTRSGFLRMCQGNNYQVRACVRACVRA
jgi:hypothetical protein